MKFWYTDIRNTPVNPFYTIIKIQDKMRGGFSSKMNKTRIR